MLGTVSFSAGSGSGTLVCFCRPFRLPLAKSTAMNAAAVGTEMVLPAIAFSSES